MQQNEKEPERRACNMDARDPGYAEQLRKEQSAAPKQQSAAPKAEAKKGKRK